MEKIYSCTECGIHKKEVTQHERVCDKCYHRLERDDIEMWNEFDRD